MLIVDEGWAIPPSIWVAILFPITRNLKTAVICVTTPGADTDPFAKFLSFQNHEGRKYCNVVHIAPVCNFCRKNGDSSNCMHMAVDLMPTHTNLKQSDLLQEMMDFSGYGDIGRQEIMAEMRAMHALEFDAGTVDEFFAHPGYSPFLPSSFVILTCDPNGGGRSGYTFASAFADKPKLAVCFFFFFFFFFKNNSCTGLKDFLLITL